jgi:PAS domain S-box-containing protein
MNEHKPMTIPLNNPDQSTLQEHTILIIDDEPANLGVISNYLESFGLEVLIARDGEAGLQKAQYGQPDLILLDVVMPGIDGFETCRGLKANEATQDIPVIFLTGITETEAKINGFRVGAVDYITKPFQPDELLARVTTHLRLRELTERLEQRVHQRTEELTRANQQLRQEIAERKRTEELLRKINRAYKALSECNQALIRATEETELLQEACRIIVEDCGYHLVWIGFAEQDEAKAVRPVAQAGYEEGYLDTVSITWADTERGRGLTGRAIRTGQPVINRDVLNNPAYAPWRVEAIKRGYASAASLPLLTGKKEAIGALNVYATQQDAFATEEISLLMELAGDLAYGVVSLRVQADRQRAEEALHQSEERFRRVITSISDHIYMTEATEMGEYINHYLSPNIEMLTGYPLEKFAGDWHFWPSSVIHPDDRAEAAVQMTRLVNGQDSETEYRLVRADGQVIWVRDSARIESAGASRFIYGVVSNITERKQVEEALRQRNRQLALLNRAGHAVSSSLELDQVLVTLLAEVRHLMEVVACSVWLVDERGGLVCRQVIGPQSEVVRGWRLPPGEGFAGSVASSGESLIVPDTQADERHYRAVDQQTGLLLRSILTVPLWAKERVIGVLQVVDTEIGRFDMADLKLLEPLAADAAIAIEHARLYEAEREQRMLAKQSQAQLVRSAKLAATGRLAASLAHEISNPLQAIHNSLRLMLTVSLKPEEEQEALRMADEEVERLINIVTRILDFARPSQQKRRPTDVNEVVKKTLALTRKYFQHQDIVLRQELSPELPHAVATSDELEQVLLNLVLNAVDAMPEGGTLHVSSRLVDDGRLAVSLSDSGVGIPPEDLEQLFEPFFSTKEGGTGLGLSISYSVIERYGGEITVQSVVGEGTTFTVWLPVPA